MRELTKLKRLLEEIKEVLSSGASIDAQYQVISGRIQDEVIELNLDIPNEDYWDDVSKEQWCIKFQHRISDFLGDF